MSMLWLIYCHPPLLEGLAHFLQADDADMCTDSQAPGTFFIHRMIREGNTPVGPCGPLTPGDPAAGNIH